MALTKNAFSNYIKEFKFRDLFNDMGWDSDRTVQPIVVDSNTFQLSTVGVKSGFKIFLCNSTDGVLPDYSTRKKIETKVTKLFQEHLIIFTDAKKHEQIWQLIVRQSGKPTKTTETRYHILQDPELLYQRVSGLFFELDEEEHITIIDVTKRVADNFHQNNERVTKQFYDKFKQQHTSFLKFIKGIDEKVNQEWYASLMLNRLMFCYFIQKKGFLDNNKNYLSDKLKESQEKKGKDKFYSFYRNFLLHLFHDGLGASDRSKTLTDEIGKIPYLNGGLFDEHELEKNHNKIEIDDKAFKNIFEFFDQYEWHLDTRHTASGKDINPDVIGYIFEKYINDRADMGAYYTKEDITDYISKNCIIPFLFDETKRQQPKSFSADAEIWKAVKESGDKYIYDAVKKGVEEKLPKEIADGIKNISARTEWNKTATEHFALPTEIWREVVDRRKRCTEIKTKIEKGEVTGINDFITYNLNIRQFAIDTIANTNDPEFLRDFYKALNSVTVIDPTCGSGAFLFAAMNILEELYEQCIQRMQNFVSDASKGKYKFFEETIAHVTAPEHPNLQYFIYKNIILRNLYGVDIMKEAVEIAKLRLFLKLVATVEANYRRPNLGLEPLPDIDFNIRIGNTLVGFANKEDVKKKGMAWSLFPDKEYQEVEDAADKVSMAFERFQDNQLISNFGSPSHKKEKHRLNDALKLLNEKLNKFLVLSYLKQGYKEKELNEWIFSHQPFHWYSQFYKIIERGGFDIIIGNPPYLEVRQIDYEPKNLKTFSSGAVHSMCIERSLQILSKEGNISMIVPLALVCTQRMTVVQNLLENQRATWYSNFAWRPAKLFENVNRALTIFVSNSSKQKEVYTTKYFKWQSETREYLFPDLNYTSWNSKRNSFWVPKLGADIETSILKKLLSSDTSVAHLLSSNSSNKIYYRTTGGLYWKIFTNFSPKFFVKGKEGKSSRETYFAVREKNQDIVLVAILSSDIFWWWYTITSNLRDLNPSDIQGFKFPANILVDKNILDLGRKYLKELDNNSEMLTRIQKQTGETQTQSFKIKLSKSTIDKIDTALAEHYGFTDEELDFIINYDIKYRMGKELESEDE